MTDSADAYFDNVDISFYGLLDPVTRLEGLDIEIEIDPRQYPSVPAIVGEIRNALAAGGVHDCVVIERRRTEFDWGASGVGEAIVVGIATAYLADAIKAVVERLVTHRGGDGVMSEAEAEQHVRQRLAVRYDLDATQLELVTVATSEGSVEVTLAHPDGAPVYRATVVGSGIGARATRLERIARPDRGL
ncbi:hypothetical protein [Georgenia daeguensis]|uniref:Uncharacterized protein n=1 Tax=Georgenia daeguensis TaxID=908355 RepID=A0ABP6UN49_9MICO